MNSWWWSKQQINLTERSIGGASALVAISSICCAPNCEKVDNFSCRHCFNMFQFLNLIFLFYASPLFYYHPFYILHSRTQFTYKESRIKSCHQVKIDGLWIKLTVVIFYKVGKKNGSKNFFSIKFFIIFFLIKIT